MTNTGVGTYHLVIPGVSPADGVLLVTPEGGGVNNGDNLASYQIHGDGWDIQTRDLTAGFTPALQNLPASDGVVSFVYIPGPVPGSTNLVWAGTGTNVWDLSGKLNWRFLTNSAAAAYIDGARVRLDDTAVTGQINLSTTVAPYSLWVSNTGLTYQLGGNGSLAGSMGLQKWGAGTLLLAETNFYLGDTVIGQGRVILGAVGALPGGVGAGQLTVDGILDLGGWPAVVNAPTGHGLIDNSGTATNVWLTILAGTNRTFAGMITNSQGTLSLRVSGAGGFKLTGAIGIRGEVEVTNGGLFISGSLQASQTRVTVGASLAGTGTVGGPVLFAAGSALQVEAGLPLTVVNPVLNGVVNLLVTGGYSLTNAGTYGLLNHGTINGSGSWQLAAPVGLACNGFAARLWDTGSQLQMIVYPAGVTGTIADVRHVVVLMNENRSFDHYFGTYHGTRGFDDHNAILLTNQFNAFYQPVNGGYELPFHTSLQCIGDLNHSWPVTHATVNGGRNDQWIPNKGPSTMAYMDRSDLSFYYALADAFTLCDEYHCSVLSSTYPNRLYLMTGMIDPTGSGGGPEIDNTQLANGFTWRTYPELLQQAGVSWKVYSVLDDDSDNVLQLFANFKRALPGTSLYDRGMSPAPTLSALVSAFKNDVASNALPSVSWIIGPGNYTEHPPYSPANGEWFTKQLLDAMAANPAVYTNTVFILNYDENDGFYDHAMPILAPPGTPDEYVGSQPIGLGVRVPAIMISPWSRGGRSCSQVFDHTSVIRFLEQWTGVTNQNISAWRRQVCGDLTSAFDFAHPQPDFPVLPQVYGISCSSGTVPEVPAQPTLPVQESGSVIRLPLPYQPEVTCSLDAAGGTLGLTLTNGGGAAVHFGVYANADRFDGPWPVEVAGGSGASQMFHLTGNGHYDFSAYGPDGFQRRFAGNLNLDARQIDAQA
ncbi:MAG TPA: phospholipase C, phosphocholine-specific, partial [Verrucomicrobiae bacterium]